MDSAALAYRLVRANKKFGELRIELAEEKTIAIYGIVEQLNGG